MALEEPLGAKAAPGAAAFVAAKGLESQIETETYVKACQAVPFILSRSAGTSSQRCFF